MSIDGTYGPDTLYGTPYADTINGLGGKDLLYGLGANDTLNGGSNDDYLDGGIGADTMRGGEDNDTYIVDNTADQVIENASEGSDLVYSSVSFTLPASVEKLILTGTAYKGIGNTLPNVMHGNAVANWLSGKDGDDSLKGFGGADWMWGGNGDDTLRGGDQNDLLFGEADDDKLYGDDGGDYLRGGSGNDVLSGGAGTDDLYGDDSDDYLDGQADSDRCFGGGGNDTIRLDFTDLSGPGTVCDGGSGASDTLAFDGGQTLDLTLLADDKLIGFENLDLGGIGGNTVIATLADLVALCGGDVMVVYGQAEDSFQSTGQGWTQLADVMVPGFHFEHYVIGVFDLYVESAIAQVIW